MALSQPNKRALHVDPARLPTTDLLLPRSHKANHFHSCAIFRYSGFGLNFSTATVGRVADGNESSALCTHGPELWTLKRIYTS